uniref:Serine aminopeptidase S33 domain-containing protein n=1 Tax=Ditylenchus dipsaci TaxID=166011 RepID=A0A915CQ96_9BILA
MRGKTYELNYISENGQTIQADSAKKAFGKASIKTRSNNHLVCLKFHPSSGRSRDLPNACDLGELFGFNVFCEMLQTDLCVFDYSGYGLSTGTASEENLYRDIQAVFDSICATNETTKVVLMGMSIGTAACVDLASKNSNRLAGMVLIAPFTSGCRLMRGQPDMKISPMCDRFRSFDKIGYVEAPVLLIHGLNDVAIPAEHSEVLYQRLRRPVPPMFIPQATHNDVLEKFPDVYHRIRWFIDQEV